MKKMKKMKRMKRIMRIMRLIAKEGVLVELEDGYSIQIREREPLKLMPI